MQIINRNFAEPVENSLDVFVLVFIKMTCIWDLIANISFTMHPVTFDMLLNP